MKLMIFFGVSIFGSIGSWLGATINHGDWFGVVSIGLGAIGSFFGVWVGYKGGQYL
jgi:hypothetical protein